MENGSQFDVEAAIATWRDEVNGGTVRGETLAELESHLRESIATLQQAGTSAEDAFAIASYRLGRAPSLRTEFAKVRAEQVWFERVVWMLLGAQVYTMVSQLATMVRSLITLPAVLSARPYHFGQIGLLESTLFWVLQYALLAAFLVGAHQLLRRSGLWNANWLAALRGNPRRSCGALAGLSMVLAILSGAVAIFLPSFFSSNTHVQFDLNLMIALVSYPLHALVLPLLLFWVLCRQERYAPVL